MSRRSSVSSSLLVLSVVAPLLAPVGVAPPPQGFPWIAQESLASDTPEALARFGDALATDGETLVVGAPGDVLGGVAAGAAYVYRRSANAWHFEARLAAADGAAGDRLATRVAVVGDTAMLSAHLDDDAGTSSGSAYVFVRDDEGTWTQQAKLTASDAQPSHFFGQAVAVSGDVAVVSALFDDDGGTDAGAAYVFERAGGAWTEAGKLVASDAQADDWFGHTIALAGSTLVVGAPHRDDDRGAAYVLERGGDGAWSETAILTASDAEPADLLGTGLSLSGDTLIVGLQDALTQPGAAYVFVRDGGAWAQEAKLAPSDGAAGDRFGIAVGVDGDHAIVGSFRADVDGATDAGAAYVFARAGSAWSQTFKLTAEGPTAGDLAGLAVAMAGRQALFGARTDTGADQAGSVLRYLRTGPA